MTDYSYAAEQCDVENLALLQRFRNKRSEWRFRLEHDDHHAIWPNLSLLIWNEARFGALSAIADATPGGPLSNQLVADLAINGHVALQVLAIRRLVDDTKGVMSLRGLLKDIRRNYDLITRENYVCFDGLPYDYQSVELEEHRRLGAGVRWIANTGPTAWASSKQAHHKFDLLSGIPPESRSRTDRLPKNLLAQVESWIEGCGADEIAKWSHQYLAHAGSKSSREQLGDYGLTGTKIDAAIVGLARAAEALSANILYGAGGVGALMPVAQFDQFEDLQHPAADAAAIELGQLRWEELADRFDNCLDDVSAILAKT